MPALVAPSCWRARSEKPRWLASSSIHRALQTIPQFGHEREGWRCTCTVAAGFTKQTQISREATRNWWPGKKLLVAPAWMGWVRGTDSKVYVGLTREAIKNGPEYAESVPITREYENRLYLHYGRPPYWLHEAEHKSSFSLSGV